MAGCQRGETPSNAGRPTYAHTTTKNIEKKIMKITLTYVARSIHHQFMSDPQIQLFTSALIIINRERKKETFC